MQTSLVFTDGYVHKNALNLGHHLIEVLRRRQRVPLLKFRPIDAPYLSAMRDFSQETLLHMRDRWMRFVGDRRAY